MKLYYTIWVDLILKAQSQPANKNDWKVMTMIFMTVPMALDLLFVMTIFEKYILQDQFYYFDIPFIPGSIRGPISFIILFVGPPLLVNYVLIFRNRRYERLIKRYKYHDGKLAVSCIIFGLFIPIIAIVVGMVFYNL